MLYAANPLTAWSTTQTATAMSSGEAELYGCVRGSAEGFGTVSGVKDMGKEILESDVEDCGLMALSGMQAGRQML